MKSLYQLSVLCVLLVDLVVCQQYQWNCTEPNENGQWYIPGVRDRVGVTPITTNGNILHIYRVQNLNANCYGPVTAIEYCYRYDRNAVSGQATFNWTMLILEEAGSSFVINRTCVIQSSLPTDNCTDSRNQFICCDVKNTENFDLPMNFIFGVTQSAQGNTHNAALLGYQEAQHPQLIVDTIQRSKSNLSLSVGSTFTRPGNPPNLRGLRMLWFVIGTSSIGSPDSPTPVVPPVTGSSMSSTGATANLPATVPTMPDNTPMSIADTTTDSVTTDGEKESALISPNILAPAVGGAVGGLIVVVIIILVVVIALLVIKRGQKRSLKVNGRKESVTVQGYNNALYDANSSNTNIHLNIPNESTSFSNATYAYIAEQAQREELGHDYSLPSEVHNGKIQPTQEKPHAAAPVYATAYETPAVSGLSSPYETALSQTEISTSYNEDIYMVPATNEDALYSQLSQIRINNFTRDSIKLTDLLGAGQFGKVHQGEWTAPGSKDKIIVAVKTLKEGASEEDKVKFLQEAAIMGQFSHPNVVKLYGVITEGEPVMLVIELLPKGDLRGVLHSVLSEPSSEVKIDADLPHTLLSYCRQVASGMNYLSNKLFVHRDLATRNILVSEDGACKIADFGMSRDLADTNYYVSHGGKIPVKWTAPEAIHYKKYSTASDVWSFGCVMYEIWSLGYKPFEQYTNQDCIKLIDKGVRLPPPTGCPRAIYKLMMDCWHPEPSSRPDFVSVVQQLSLPDTRLLKWSEEDKATDPEAPTLGAGLDKAIDLYNDLQKRYVTN